MLNLVEGLLRAAGGLVVATGEPAYPVWMPLVATGEAAKDGANRILSAALASSASSSSPANRLLLGPESELLG